MAQLLLSLAISLKTSHIKSSSIRHSNLLLHHCLQRESTGLKPNMNPTVDSNISDNQPCNASVSEQGQRAIKKTLSIKMQHILQKNVSFCHWTKTSLVFSKKLGKKQNKQPQNKKNTLRLNKILQGFLTIHPLPIRPRLSLISDSDVHVGRGERAQSHNHVERADFLLKQLRCDHTVHQSVMLMT